MYFRLDETLKKYIGKSEIFAFLTTFIVGIISHFYIFTHNVLAPDALAVGTYKIAGLWEISLGRWGITFFDNLRGGIVNEFMIIVASLAFLGLSSLFICKIFNIKKYIYIFLISALIALTPQFSTTFLFIYCADSYCFAMFSVVLAVYFIKNKMKKNFNYILGITLIVISLSLYQAYVAISVSLLILLAIIDLLMKNDWKKVLKELIINLVTILLGMILYFVITKIILKINGISFASYKGADTMGLKSIITNLPVTLISTYKSFIQYYFKDTILYNSYWHRDAINFILFLATGISLIYIIIKKMFKKEVLNKNITRV